jgi:hypothetical protein
LRNGFAIYGSLVANSLSRYTTKWIKNSQAGPYIWDTVGVNKSSDPAERIKPGETRAERRAREKAGREKREQAAAARAARDRAAKLRAEAESAEREELLRQQLARQRDRLRDHHTSREQMLNSRLEKLMSNQTAWAERFQRKDGGRVAPAPKVSDVPIILDTRKYYATLGVTPGPELLDEKDENKINDMLKGRMYALTRQYHPDRALNAADEDRRNKMMAHINVAYAHVETLAWRRFYHDPIKNPDPSKRAASKP